MIKRSKKKESNKQTNKKGSKGGRESSCPIRGQHLGDASDIQYKILLCPFSALLCFV